MRLRSGKRSEPTHKHESPAKRRKLSSSESTDSQESEKTEKLHNEPSPPSKGNTIPAQEKSPPSPSRYVQRKTVGDVHGNTKKLLQILAKFRIIQDHQLLNDLVKTYDNIATMLNKDTKYDSRDTALFKELISIFQTLLEKSITPSKTEIRFLGDVLADRGALDLLTLLTLTALKRRKCAYKVLFSNHDIEFILNMEERKSFVTTNILDKMFARSMTNMQKLIDNRVVERIYIEELYALAYKSKQVLFDCSIHIDKKTKTEMVHFFSHAPVGLRVIYSFSQLFSIPFKNDSPENLKSTINRINAHYLENYVKKNRVSDLFKVNEGNRHNFRRGFTLIQNANRANTGENKIQIAEFIRQYPAYFLTWNRSLQGLSILREYKNFKLFFHFGHTKISKLPDNMFCHDDLIGKMRSHGSIKNIDDINVHSSLGESIGSLRMESQSLGY